MHCEKVRVSSFFVDIMVSFESNTQRLRSEKFCFPVYLEVNSGEHQDSKHFAHGKWTYTAERRPSIKSIKKATSRHVTALYES